MENKKRFVMVVSGSRMYKDFLTISRALDMILMLKEINPEKSEIVIRQGGAVGVDREAEKYANYKGYINDKQEADWTNLKAYPCIVATNRYGEQYNRLAGHNRNEQMIVSNDVDVVVMFSSNNSAGTRNAYKLSQEHKKDYYFICIDKQTVEVGMKGEAIETVTLDEFLTY